MRLKHLALGLAVATALPDWHDALAVYVPEPFRALG